MIQEKPVLHFDFAYTDEFGNETRLEKSVEPEYLGMCERDVMFDIFKDFVRACGFCIDYGSEIVVVKE